MPGGLLDGALPIGMLMFLMTALGFLWRKVDRKRSARDYPELARELGLRHTPARYAGAAGVLAGQFGGRDVRIDPDDQRSIKVRFRGAPRVDLRTYENSPRPPFGMVTIYSKNRAFNRYFKTRFATQDIATRIADSPLAGDGPLAAFTGRLARQVQAVTVTSDGVVCRLDFGNPPYIPPAALKELLPACVELAEWVEPSDAPPN